MSRLPFSVESYLHVHNRQDAHWGGLPPKTPTVRGTGLQYTEALNQKSLKNHPKLQTVRSIV